MASRNGNVSTTSNPGQKPNDAKIHRILTQVAWRFPCPPIWLAGMLGLAREAGTDISAGHDVQNSADLMRRFLDRPDVVGSMECLYNVLTSHDEGHDAAAVLRGLVDLDYGLCARIGNRFVSPEEVVDCQIEVGDPNLEPTAREEQSMIDVSQPIQENVFQHNWGDYPNVGAYLVDNNSALGVFVHEEDTVMNQVLMPIAEVALATIAGVLTDPMEVSL